jgi:serine O-acetyltransferase
MELVNSSRRELVEYVSGQLRHFFPDKHDNLVKSSIGRSIDTAIERMRPSVKLSRMWPQNKFYYLHSNQYAVFLYYLANSVWREQKDAEVASKIYSLNKALNGLEIFYEIEMPAIFCITHSPGIVLSRADYSDFLVLYQNSTVGRVHPEELPKFEKGVVLYPNSAVIGKCHIKANSFIAQGQSVIDADTPGNCVVFNNAGQLVFKEPKFDIMNYFFRMDEA